MIVHAETLAAGLENEQERMNSPRIVREFIDRPYNPAKINFGPLLAHSPFEGVRLGFLLAKVQASSVLRTGEKIL
jgi:hypothetical protein